MSLTKRRGRATAEAPSPYTVADLYRWRLSQTPETFPEYLRRTVPGYKPGPVNEGYLAELHNRLLEAERR
jgi:hypothetical protein